MVAQRDDFYREPAHRPFLEIDVLNRLGMLLPSDVLLKADAEDASASWKSKNWSEAIPLDQITWHREDMSDLYIQYEDVLSKRVGAPSFCDQAHISFDSSDWHVVKVKQAQGTVYVAAKLDALSARLFKFFSPSVLPIAVFLMLLLTVCVAWLSRFISRPLNQLTHAMRYDGVGLSRQRIELQSSIPELKALVDSYNEMLDGVRKSIIQAQRFSADAAHELKTPLTILQGRLEAAISKTNDLDTQQELSALQAEISHLTSITRKLLLLSQADTGNLVLDRKNIDWSIFITELIKDSSVYLNSQQLHLSIEPSLSIKGDAMLLLRLSTNLLTNIAKYALPDAPVHISSARVAGMVETRFRNVSVPLSAEQRANLFDRFYRAGVAATGDNSSGVGLGLSLSREIARAHGGDLVLEDTAADIVEFKLTLPES